MRNLSIKGNLNVVQILISFAYTNGLLRYQIKVARISTCEMRNYQKKWGEIRKVVLQWKDFSSLLPRQFAVIISKNHFFVLLGSQNLYFQWKLDMKNKTWSSNLSLPAVREIKRKYIQFAGKLLKIFRRSETTHYRWKYGRNLPLLYPKYYFCYAKKNHFCQH